jgi:hypothetical protein
MALTFYINVIVKFLIKTLISGNYFEIVMMP